MAFDWLDCLEKKTNEMIAFFNLSLAFVHMGEGECKVVEYKYLCMNLQRTCFLMANK
jgi:hypothetical protein